MARKIVLIVVLLAGAALGLAWYLGDSQPVPETEAVPALAEVAAPPAGTEEASAPVIVAVPVSHPEALDRTPGASVIGQPFVLSDSVLANCERWPNNICKDFLLFVERMGAEPRHESWARDMEARIEKAVLSGERGKFRINALECRSTRCALEVASEVDYSGIDDIDPSFDAIMVERPGYIAHEDDPKTGIRTLITTQVWQTEESLDAEEAMTD